MSAAPALNVGLLGLGVVGGGVAAALLDPSAGLAAKAGRPLTLKKALVRDTAKSRDTAVPAALLTANPEEILADPSIGLVVEVIGGVDPAAQYLRAALSAGKHVVTANKEVMAKHGPELLALARQNRVQLLFEASVGGGIPILGCLRDQLQANQFRSIRSIINGTTNYILTRMANDHTPFRQALAEAQERGYAEADPSSDIEGSDAVYKLSIMAALAFHQRIAPEDIYRQGIAQLEPQDFRYARELGYAIKSLAIATLDNDAVQARVYPALLPGDSMLAKVDGVYNAVEVAGSQCGRVLFHGQGAGRGPTTSAVVGDIIAIARQADNIPPQPEDGDGADTPVARPGRIQSIAELECKYYLRLNVTDGPGVLAQIAQILGQQRISIAAVLQKDTDPVAQTAEIVITTHPSRESSVQQSLQLLAGLEVVREISNLLRIED